MPDRNKTIFEVKDNLVEFYLQRLEKDDRFIEAMQKLSNSGTPLQDDTILCIAQKLFSEIRSDFLKQTDFCYELGTQTPNKVIGFHNGIVEEFLEMGLLWMMSAKHIQLQGIGVRERDIEEIYRHVVTLSEKDSQVPVFEK